MRSTLLIANAGAGAGDQAAIRAAVERLRREAVEVEVASTDGASALDDVLRERGDRDVVVAGGDGSMHSVVAALARRHELDGPTLGLIPLGTGNDFARSLGIPLDPSDAAEVCARGATRAVDILDDSNGGVVVNAVNIGAAAEASRHAAGLKRFLGRAAYIGGALAAVTERGHRLRVEADGELLADGTARVLQVGIGNGRFVGAGTPLAPEAMLTDGRVDVVVSFAVGPVRRFSYALDVRLRRHLRRSDVATARATVVRVSGEAYRCSVDGELSEPITDRTWSVRPRAISMAVPSDAP